MIKLELPDEMVQIIGVALDHMPHGQVRRTVDEIQRQINAQAQEPSDQVKTNGKAEMFEEQLPAQG